jgi:hypothetical protein
LRILKCGDRKKCRVAKATADGAWGAVRCDFVICKEEGAVEKISSSVPGSEQGQCERELALVLEIDRIRDEYASQPQSMLEQITAVAAKTLQADIGLLAVTKDDTELSLVAQIDPANILPSIPADALLDLAREAMTLLDAERRSPNDLLESCGICDLLLSPLSVGRERLGSLIFATLNR